MTGVQTCALPIYMAGAGSHLQVAEMRSRAHEEHRKTQARLNKINASQKILKIKELLEDPFIINLKELKQLFRETKSLIQLAKEYFNCEDTESNFEHYTKKFDTRTSKALLESRLIIDKPKEDLGSTALPLCLLPEDIKIKMTEFLNLRETLSLRTTSITFYSPCTLHYRMPSSFMLQGYVFFQPKIETYDTEGTPTLLSKSATLGLCVKYVKTSTPLEEKHLNPLVFINQLRRDLLSDPKKLKTFEAPLSR